MRHAEFFTALLLLAGAGCKNLSPEPTPAPAPAPAATRRLIVPLDGVVGRVQSVNERLHFVVLDYSLNSLPAVGESLDLLRDDTVIGELKVTGPVRNAGIVADIVRGNPKVGDIARPKSVAPAP